MSKQKLVLILGTVLALITVVLVKFWMDQQRAIYEEAAKTQAVKEQVRYISILVAKQEIPAGSPIDPAFVEAKSFPDRQVTLDAVTSLDRIQGMVTIANILQGEPITITKLAFPRGASGLAEITPSGRRAITISVDNIAAVAGMVKPGDHVDVIVLISVPVKMPDGTQMNDNRVIPLFQNIEVLAVGQNTVGSVRQAARYTQEQQAEAKPAQQSPLITLSLTPQESGILAYISEQGKLRLVLRNPADTKTEKLQITDLAALLNYLSPQPEKVELPKPTGYVDVYSGIQKRKVPLRD